ncbi:MAG: hypothetical protein OXU20_33255 [Myxococcales bacterium]|nr:hypothetical protein [Myxococcales bacterium]MDD9967066.1 hypothetical protein [Myxococcales bacterium]
MGQDERGGPATGGDTAGSRFDLTGPERSPDPPKQPVFRSGQGRLRLLAQRWQGETFDPTWTEATREYVLETANAAEMDAEAVQDVDCRTTTCRVELLWPTPQEAGRYAESAYSPDLDYVVEFGQVGNSVRTIVFMARPGERLEDFASAEAPEPQPIKAAAP